MKERPILFSGEMVRALLEGRKTQTRRVVKARGWSSEYLSERELVNVLHGESASGLSCAQPVDSAWAGFKLSPGCHSPSYFKCPCGQPGDRLWVRETWCHTGAGVWKVSDAALALGGELIYRADKNLPGIGWFPSIHMPRWAGRITLEIVSVRVERLQEISEAEAIAEGIKQQRFSGWFSVPGIDGAGATARAAFALLWQSINGPDSWDANPWVWVVEFRRVDQARSVS